MTTILIFLGGSWAFWAGSFYPSNTLDRTLAGDAKFLVRDLIVLPKIYQQLFTDCHTLQQSLLTVWELIDSDYARIRTEYYHNFTYGPLVMINVNFHNFFLTVSLIADHLYGRSSRCLSLTVTFQHLIRKQAGSDIQYKC